MFKQMCKNVVPPENNVFLFFKELGPQIGFQMLSLTILVGVGSGVCPKSAWSPSYEKKFLENAQIWTTPSNINTIILLGVL